MVHLQVYAAIMPFLLLAMPHAESHTSQWSTKSQFRSIMRKALRGDKDVQMHQTIRMRKLTAKIASKSKVTRNLNEYYEAGQAEDTEYYAEAEDEADVDEATYYTEDEQEEEESVEYYKEDGDEEEEYYYNKAWGNDDGYDYNGLTFDITQFSLKMHSCRSLTDFDLDDLNEGQVQENEYEREDLKEIAYPFSGVPYVNYRLCPTSTCQDDGWKGCRNVYGNYIISLEEYFQITEERLESELEEYCDYCKKCHYFYKYFNATCEYYDECDTYSNVCNYNDGADDGGDDAGDDAVEQIQYQEYLECTAVEKSYYQQYYNAEEEEEYDENVYLKIFCDGSIKIGIFSDDECTNYIGKTTTIYQLTGMKILEDDLETEFMNHECIHCGKSNHKYYAMNQDKYEENADDDQDEVFEICEELYEDSAKCNAFLPEPANNESAYYQNAYYEYDEEWEETKNPTTCAYMEAVQKGNIDKYGFVYLSNNLYFKKYVNRINNDILPEGYFITDEQFFAIIGAAIFCLTLMIYGITKPSRKMVDNKELKATLV